MSAIYFTVVAVALYFVSDWLLQAVEAQAGRRFEYRTLIFFVILRIKNLLKMLKILLEEFLIN